MVGAGPTGLLLTSELQRSGVSTATWQSWIFLALLPITGILSLRWLKWLRTTRAIWRYFRLVQSDRDLVLRLHKKQLRLLASLEEARMIVNK